MSTVSSGRGGGCLSSNPLYTSCVSHVVFRSLAQCSIWSYIESSSNGQDMSFGSKSEKERACTVCRLFKQLDRPCRNQERVPNHRPPLHVPTNSPENKRVETWTVDGHCVLPKAFASVPPNLILGGAQDTVSRQMLLHLPTNVRGTERAGKKRHRWPRVKLRFWRGTKQDTQRTALLFNAVLHHAQE